MTKGTLVDYSEKRSRSFFNILIATLGLLIIPFLFSFILKRQVWAVDTIFFGGVFILIYFLRKMLNLTPFLFILLAILVLAHCYAVFGFFKMTFFGQEYDTYIHSYSSVIIAMMAFNYFRKFNIGYFEIIIFALLITLGMGLFNELMEFAGYKIFGTGEGFFLLGPGDIGNTNAYENLMTDFFNDFYGNLIGLLLVSIYYFVRKGKK